jgi:hypothetical protein
MSWKIVLARMLSIGLKGESTKDMMGRPLWNAFFFFGQNVASRELATFACGIVFATLRQGN